MQKNFIACQSCTDCMFCDDKCIKTNTVHKLLCGISLNQNNVMVSLTAESILLATIAFPNADRLMKFVESALATRDLDTPECDTDAQAKYRMFLKLFALPKEFNQVSQWRITLVYRMVMEIPQIQQLFQSTQTKRFLMHLILQHFCIIQTNTKSFEYGDEETGAWQDVWMVANCFSLFNHSCYPNAMHCRQGNQMFICTVRPIKKGEQSFIKYSSTSEEIGFQQTDLPRNFQFQCKCSKCIQCWKLEDCMRIQMDTDFLFISQIDQSCFENSD